MTESGTIRDLVARIAAVAPGAEATAELDGERLTFGGLAARVNSWCDRIPAGARRVAVHCANDNDNVARICAVWQSGASAVLLGALLPAAEAQRRVVESCSDAVLGRDDIAAELAPGDSPAEPDEILVVCSPLAPPVVLRARY
ncbi:hypothetical protein [Nocardia sp. NPDC005366]|uniref:hypothetical protein n=1 Tax=Nocardia sp. NPDC005366 TaxID=3156878 RepID=UPI0033B361F0